MNSTHEIFLKREEPSATATDWGMIAAAASPADDPAAARAMERLARRYWPAVYAFVRSTGRDVHEAADVTQGFICDVVLTRRLLELADPQRGRFRSLLLTALRNYVRDAERTRRRRAQGPKPVERKQPTRRLSGIPAFMLNLRDVDGFDPMNAPSPEAAFSAQWTSLLVRNVLEQVRTACLKDGLEPHWVIFEHRVVRPMLFGEEPVSYAMLAERLDLADPSQGPNMMVTVKRRFAKALYLEVCTTVDRTIDAEGELFELLRDIEKQ